jgi:hypothetical protein
MPSRLNSVEKTLGSGAPSGVSFAGLVLVAVEAIDVDAVEGFEIALAHAGVGEAVEPGVVGDEADDALGGRTSSTMRRSAMRKKRT